MYGQASFHAFLQHTHTQTQCPATECIKWRWPQPRHPEHPPCTYFCIPSGGNKMTCCGEMCAGNKAKQNRCQTSWHFYSGNSNLGWQNEMNPPTPPTHHQAVCRQAAPPGWLPPSPHTPPWQPVLNTTIRTVPFLARCLRRQQQQMTRWEAGKIYSSLFCTENCQSVKKKQKTVIHTTTNTKTGQKWNSLN